jgi:4-amino-4-deoxy-L-arabinose transferase-like glycosyltransferase
MESKVDTVGAEHASSFQTLLIPIGLGLTMLLATWLRFYRLAGQSLWSDEGNSVALAQASLAEIASRTALDIHPPLYYWLLHGWMRVFGESEVAVRSLSAVTGVLLVGVVYGLGTRLFDRRVGLMAALIAAVSPFQVYYSQEARMYALLAFLGALAVWATVELERAALHDVSIMAIAGWAFLYVLGATLGLYTHYAFPVILVVTNLVALIWLWRGRGDKPVARWAVGWLALQLVPLMLYLPWLPTAWRQLTTWPVPPPTNAGNAWFTISRTLIFGPAGVGTSNFWLIGFGLLGLVAIARLLRREPLPKAALLLLYLGLPIALTLALFKPAYLKFLLVASPALCLLLALGLLGARPAKGVSWMAWPAAALLGVLGAGVVLAAAWGPLQAYYTDPNLARDDYRAMARYLETVAGPDDGIILNAAGQQEVFGYYYKGDTPVYPLPRSRPLDPEATVGELEAILAQSRRIFVLYWATDESDPGGVIQGWLDEHAFKATHVWVGKVRLVSYAAPLPTDDLLPADVRLGDQVTLTGFRVLYPSTGEDLAGTPSSWTVPGEIVQVQLRWRTDTPLDARYVVFLQVLDEANRLVGQRDAEPAISTLDWRPAQPVLDRHGLLIEPGTPPGEYRIIAGLYDAATGQRLPTNSGDFVELATFRVERPASPPRQEALRFQHPANVDLGPLHLLGYDQYKLGHSYDHDTPLHPGDPLHVVLYWQAQSRPQTDWQLAMQLAPVANPDSPITEGVFPAAGVDYPTSHWGTGEVVRGQFDLFLPGDALPGKYRVNLSLLNEAGTSATETFTLAPISVE